MKKLTVLFALFAALALAGCGIDEPKAKTPESTPQAAPAETTNTKIKQLPNGVTLETLPDGTTIKTHKNGSQTVTKPDGTKIYKSGTGGPKIESTGEGIHHFSK